MSVDVSTEVPRSRPQLALWAWLGFGALLTLIAFAGSGASEGDEPLVYSYTLTVGAIIQGIILVAVALGIAHLYRSRNHYDTMGLRRFSLRDVGLALSVAVVAVIVGSAFEQVFNASEEQGIVAETWDPTKATPFILNAILIVALVPFVEELFFRGVGVRVLSTLGVPFAIIGTGVMFGLVHGIPGALPALIIFGIGLAYVRHRTHSVFPAVIAHGAFNGVGLAVSFAG